MFLRLFAPSRRRFGGSPAPAGAGICRGRLVQDAPLFRNIARDLLVVIVRSFSDV